MGARRHEQGGALILMLCPNKLLYTLAVTTHWMTVKGSGVIEGTGTMANIFDRRKIIEEKIPIHYAR